MALSLEFVSLAPLFLVLEFLGSLRWLGYLDLWVAFSVSGVLSLVMETCCWALIELMCVTEDSCVMMVLWAFDRLFAELAWYLLTLS